MGASRWGALVAGLIASLGGVSGGWLDPDTPLDANTAMSHKTGEVYHLVMSDEFNVENRTFANGEDPTWTAMDHSDDARTAVGEGSLMFYNHSYVSTVNGKLNITTTSELTKWKGFNPYKKKYDIFQKEFRGGMLQSWNKFCFSGGIVEISVKLPGDPEVAGLWPAFWLMGNLGRATYEHSTNMMWPWSFNKCDRKQQRAQEVSACGVTRHWDMHKNQGRGATEIDILEVMAGPAPLTKTADQVVPPYLSTTLQVSPGVKTNRPVPGKAPQIGQKWYDGMVFGPLTKMNTYFYGTLLDKTQKDEPTGRSVSQVYQADALSALTSLNKDLWETFHTFRLEWVPGPDGYIAWYMDNQFLYEVPATALDEATGSQVPEEPSYLIINTAVSTTWGFPLGCPEGCPCNCYDCSKPECRCGMPQGFCDMLPASMLVDWVRVYQRQNDSLMFTGCDNPKYPTRKYIKAHNWRYIRDTEKIPLAPIQKGFGTCKKDEDCYPGGTCNRRKRACSCQPNWVGPTCKQPDYYDDTDNRAVLRLPFDAPRLPYSLLIIGTILVAGLVAAVMTAGAKKGEERKRRRAQQAQAAAAGGESQRLLG